MISFIRLISCSLILLGALTLTAQSTFQGKVLDSNSRNPLAYCSVAIQGTSEGTITNEEGIFRIEAHATDQLVFSFIGYETQMIQAADLRGDRVILLKPAEIRLREITVHAGDDFIYDILNECKKKIREYSTSRQSKVYYALNTTSESQPVELLECYYNARMEGLAIEELLLKNGRTGLAPFNNHFFVSLNLSKAVCDLRLTREDFFPGVILEFSKWRMKRLFDVDIRYAFDKLYQIDFNPKKKNRELFSGSVWIDKATQAPVKIKLTGDQIEHPFEPAYPGDSLYDMTYEIVQQFREVDGEMAFDLIRLNYDMMMHSVRDTPAFKSRSVITRNIEGQGVVYFYDYGQPFILPYFEYDPGYGDYRKMTFIPYSEAFWQEHNKLVLTEEQRNSLIDFASEGFLVNYMHALEPNQYWGIRQNKKFFETNNIFWFKDKRLTLDHSLKNKESLKQEELKGKFRSDLYDLQVQILLDVTRIRDSLQWRSYTVFDVFKSFYHLPEHQYTNVFLNIYFDLCEIERRQMEHTLQSKTHTLNEIDSIYKETVAEMHRITEQFADETQSGTQPTALRKWNDYVDERLNINNMALFTQGDQN